MNFDSPDGKYSHGVTNPRLLTVFESESVCFHTVSVDLTPRFIIKNFQGAKGRKPTYKIYGLFITDLATGACSVELMDHATATHVVGAIASFSHKFRKPAMVICDAGPQLKTLESNPVWEGLKRSGIQVKGVAPRHQFLNFSERVYQEWKTLMMGMRSDVNRTIYSQDDTLIELTHKFNLAFHILNCAPILVKHSDEEERLVLRQEILKPYLSKETIDDFMRDLLSTATGQRDQLYSSILDYNDTIKRNVSELIRSYLMEKGVTYKDVRKGGGTKQSVEGLHPQVNDVVLLKDSKDHIRFGLILEILESNTVKIRVISRGKPKEEVYHVQLLKLVYRSSNKDCHLNIE